MPAEPLQRRTLAASAPDCGDEHSRFARPSPSLLLPNGAGGPLSVICQSTLSSGLSRPQRFVVVTWFTRYLNDSPGVGCSRLFGGERECHRTDVTFTIELEREEDGCWLAEIDALPRVLCYGNDRDEAMVNRAVVFRAASDVGIAARAVMATVSELDPDLELPAAVTLDQRLLRQMAPQQFGVLVLGSLGAIALLLTLLGTYVLAETTALMRTRELGVRAALGATTGELLALVLRETALLVGMGLGAGLLLLFLGANLIRAFLFRIHPFDAATLGTVAIVIALLAAAVSARPALRAARVDLAEVLRSQ